jgi:hypothetical protein
MSMSNRRARYRETPARGASKGFVSATSAAVWCCEITSAGSHRRQNVELLQPAAVASTSRPRESANGQRISADVASLAPPGEDDAFSISAKAFEEQFGENILETLDIDRWRLGNDLDQEYRRIEHEVREAEKIETANEKKIREDLLPRLAALPNMPKNAGKHQTTAENIASVHRGLLFNGGVEACDGTIQIHETLP